MIMSTCNSKRWLSLFWLVHSSPTPTTPVSSSKTAWMRISLCYPELLLAPHQHRMRHKLLTFRPSMVWLISSTSLSYNLPPYSLFLSHTCLLAALDHSSNAQRPQGLCTYTLLLPGWLLSRCYKAPSSFYSGLCWDVPSLERASLTTWSEIAIHSSYCFIFHHCVCEFTTT